MKKRVFLFAGIFALALASCSGGDIEEANGLSSSSISEKVFCQIGSACNLLPEEACQTYKGNVVPICPGEQSSSSGGEPTVIGSSSSEAIVDGSSSSETEGSSSGADISSSSAETSSSSISSSSVLPVTMDIPESGYYSGGVPRFAVPAETEQGIVYCDSTGAVPNANSAIKSGTELNITQNRILRCAYFKDGVYSKSILRSYITDRLPALPIVSIAVNPDSMFNNSKALYRSGTGPIDCGGGAQDFYTEEEIPIHLDFFENGASFKWSNPAGIKIHGGCSRVHPKKSVIISFREAYGQKNLTYPLFPEHPRLTKFKHFMLRNNGNNFPNDYIRDMFMTSLTEGLDIDYQKGRSVVVYYNGRYYGIHNLRERANSDYFETNYGYNDKSVNLVDVENGGEVSKGSDADYQSIVTWLNGIGTLTDIDYGELERRIDVDNFTNHFQSRIFYRDADWPGKNMKRWSLANSSPKWRWLMFDTDHGFGSWGSDHLSNNGINMLQLATATNGPSWPNPPHSTLMLRKLLTNVNYKNAFINRFSLLIATYFTSARAKERINALMAPIQNEISYDQDRFPRYSERPLSTITSFADSRPASMQTELESFFSLGSPVDLTLRVSGSGKILVHNLPVLNNNAKFKVYPTVPITIKAVPSSGAFSGWSDGNASAERTIYITETTELIANF